VAVNSLIEFDIATWQTLSSVIERIVESADEDQLRDLYDVAVTSGDASFVDWLGPRIARRLALDVADRSTSDVAIALADRWRHPTAHVTSPVAAARLLAARIENLQQRVNQANDAEVPPELVAECSQVATQTLLAACGSEPVLHKPPRLEDFRPLTEIDPTLAQFALVAGQLLPSQQRDFDRAIGVLTTNEPSASPSQVTMSLDRLAAVADRVPDISREQARALAERLMMLDDDAELVAMYRALGRLRHWRNLVLATADALPASSASIEHLTSIVEGLTAESADSAESSTNDAADERQRLSLLVLDYAARALEQTMRLDEATSDWQWEALRGWYEHTYIERAVALGIDLQQLQSSRDLAELAELVGQAWLGQRIAASAADRASVEARSRVVARLATSSLDRLIQTNRVWLEVCASDLPPAADDPEFAARLDSWIDEIDAGASRAAVLAQMELVLARLWLREVQR
jgi:hypothetical protein